MKNSLSWLGAAAIAAASLGNVAHAASVDFKFTSVVTPPSGAVAGSASWLDVLISDTATPGTVSITITANLTGLQTLTGLWLNTTAAAGVGTGLTFSGGSGSGEVPSAVASDSAQTLKPGAATNQQVGFYNIQLTFPNSGGTFQGSETETFLLVGGASSGLNALSFLKTAKQTGAGNPDPAPYALAGLTNANGTAGGGVAFIASVPEPGTYAMWLAGVGMLGLLASRRSKS